MDSLAFRSREVCYCEFLFYNKMEKKLEEGGPGNGRVKGK